METYKPRSADQEKRVYALAMPMSLYQRVVAAAGRDGSTMAQWMRDAITEKLEQS